MPLLALLMLSVRCVLQDVHGVPYFVPRWAYFWEDVFSRAPDPRSQQDGEMRGRREVFLGMEASAATGTPLILSKLHN